MQKGFLRLNKRYTEIRITRTKVEKCEVSLNAGGVLDIKYCVMEASRGRHDFRDQIVGYAKFS